MAEIGTAVASTIVERVLTAIIARARYLFRFNKYVIDLRKSKKVLEKTLQHMKERTKEATTNAEKIVQPVEEWVNDVEKVLEEVVKLEESIEEARKCCLNVTTQYSLAKEVTCMTQQMDELNSNNKFEPFSHPIELSSMNYFFPKDFVALDSRKQAYEKLLKAIQDENSNVIGLVGIGGSGKTTLAKVVGKQVEELKLFDKVVMTVVSQDVNVRDIQGQIADNLTFPLMEETERGRALRLSHRLKTEKILIILDDVWEKLDLEAIGIPLNENDKKCCILFTTRNQEVCTSMNCQSITELSVLTEDEGWDLFKDRAQIDDDSPEELREVAKSVFNKCEGELIAILTVGSTLKGNNLMRWELALSRLETCQSIDVGECLTSTYECNELEEIICLDSEEAGKLRYLYAPSQPVFPKLEKILIKGCKKLKTIFFPSIVSSLPELKELSVHDCVELVEIISLHSSEEGGQLKNLSTLSQQISFPKLRVIEITRCNKLKTIFFATVVSSLPQLKELSVCNCNKLEEIISSDSEEAQKPRNLPAPSHQFFPKLWRINIESCNKLKTLFTAATVTSLPELEQIVVKDCNQWEEMIFSDLEQAGPCRNRTPPYQEVYFPKLRSIEIERCNKFKTIFTTKFVRSLPDLNQLIVKDCNEWMETISSDLEQATQLENLFADSEKVCLPKLQRIEIESCKKLKTIFPATIVTSLPDLQQLVVKDCNEWEEIISTDSKEAGQDGILFAPSKQVYFPRLREIEIEKCNKLKAIFSATIVTILPELEQLVVKGCNQWEEIISLDTEEVGQLSNLSAQFKQVCFPRLRKIEIERCNKLKAIFSATIVTRLPRLEQLIVKDCNEWEDIISLDSNKARKHINLFAPFQQVCFPILCGIEIERCNKLKAIFSATIVTRLPRLEHLIVKDCNEWEEIISLDSNKERKHINQYAPSQQVCFPMLWGIEIEKCKKLKTIFSKAIVTSLPELFRLVVKDCSEWEEIISLESEEAIQLKNLSPPYQQVCFPKLQIICIEGCNKLKTIFNGTIVTSLPELDYLAIKDCNEWDEIISLHSEETVQLRNISAPSPQICFPKLQSIWIAGCNKLKKIVFATVVSSLPNLQSLSIFDCDMLEDIISSYSNEAEQQHRSLLAPPQQFCFPKLRNILIMRCNKMKKVFCTTTVSSLPELQRLWVLDCIELENIISSDSKEADSLRNLSAPSQQVYFPKLDNVYIERCNKLEKIFSSTIVISLPELVDLHVKECDELEDILSLDSEEVEQLENLSALSQQVRFPKLCSIRIEICNKLKCIFSYSMAGHCPSLGSLGIELCSQLENIVKFEHKATSEEGGGMVVDDDGKHLLFPNLFLLELKKLPILTGIFPWFEFQNGPLFQYGLLIIEDCPEYKSMAQEQDARLQVNRTCWRT
ncbi:disease resistance protein RPS5-like [Gastrolobium bilobum]|uniref:disease resistance protein RPS5-like n=1 Tax=Gastrolobium bilobum TaxID=150636 RepID=UPI002AAF9A80|nr:disease resistance protein RPS5-like [Gastrolobium bilobum]